MWQIMWKLRKTSTKWKKKTAKNAIFVLVDKGLPKQFRDRASYLSAPCGRNVTPAAAVCNLSPTFFLASKFCTLARREWSAELCTICLYLFFHFSGKTWHLERITVRYLKRDIWYVNSHGSYPRHSLNLMSFVKSGRLKFAKWVKCWF